MTHGFVSLAGSIPGRDHVLMGKGNQDAWGCLQTDEALVAVVCDGCGSGQHSVVGAQLGARLIPVALVDGLAEASGSDVAAHARFAALLEKARGGVLNRLRSLAQAMIGEPAQLMQDYFLFTVVGLIVTADQAAIFSLGDGVFALNGEVSTIGPFPGNAPPYLGYALVDPGADPPAPEPRFQIHRVVPTTAVDSIMIATDGALDLVAAETERIPGTDEQVGPIHQFWEEARYRRGPDLLRRRLARLNRRVSGAAALLSDDTTLVVITRSQEAG